jgi:hypothetical protein
MSLSLLILVDRVNVKLGGVNVIVDPAGGGDLNDPNNPTIVMGMLHIVTS